MDSSSKFFFSFSVNYVMIVKLVDLIVLLGSKLLNRFRKIFNRSFLLYSIFSPCIPTEASQRKLLNLLFDELEDIASENIVEPCMPSIFLIDFLICLPCVGFPLCPDMGR